MAIINIKDELTNLATNGRTGANGVAIHAGWPWIDSKTGVQDKSYRDNSISGIGVKLNQCPLSIGIRGKSLWELPFDPVISVQGKNVITRRYVAKGTSRGTVKELWSEDDLDIDIAGLLIGKDADELQEQIYRLREILTAGEMIVAGELMDWYNVQSVVVESFSFPHTKGLNAQAYQIKCYSDDLTNLLIDV